eukprot:CAMPEP_0185187848 /NCGR_PEP_ID=MMETSP1140-20130426/5028_1 /TAXON_ID=298111 /ORGANISM="Pavlova sp., Strain CCMP459" /LENGTH=48 /DNA_ID= /DNA_START= /DNA_END= /DNA_ORIENTATION=
MTVFELPPSADWSRRVSTELRKGTKVFFLGLPEFSARAVITWPSAVSD